VGYTGVPLALLAVLVSGLLLMSGEERDIGSPAEPAAAQHVPALAGGALVVAELAAPSSLSDRQMVSPPLDPDVSADRTSVAAASGPSGNAPPQETLQRAAPNGVSMTAMPDGHDPQLHNEPGKAQDGEMDSGTVAALEFPAGPEQAAADSVGRESVQEQDTGMTSGAAAEAGSTAATQQAAEPTASQDRAAPVTQSADSDTLVGIERVLSSTASAQTGAAAEVPASVAQAEAHQPDAAQQHI
jgi:hypothetical protein